MKFVTKLMIAAAVLALVAADASAGCRGKLFGGGRLFGNRGQCAPVQVNSPPPAPAAVPQLMPVVHTTSYVRQDNPPAAGEPVIVITTPLPTAPQFTAPQPNPFPFTGWVGGGCQGGVCPLPIRR